MSHEIEKFFCSCNDREKKTSQQISKLQFQIDKLYTQVNSIDQKTHTGFKQIEENVVAVSKTLHSLTTSAAHGLELEQKGLERKLVFVADRSDMRLREEEENRRKRHMELLDLIDKEQKCLKMLEVNTIERLDGKFKELDLKICNVVSEQTEDTGIITNIMNTLKNTITSLREDNQKIVSKLEKEVDRLKRETEAIK
ncbi:hypothetical protein HK096_000837, partial [Nowakowskiella sp. JEL0078]